MKTKTKRDSEEQGKYKKNKNIKNKKQEESEDEELEKKKNNKKNKETKIKESKKHKKDSSEEEEEENEVEIDKEEENEESENEQSSEEILKAGKKLKEEINEIEDFAGLTKQQILQIIENDSAEVISIMNDMKSKLSELKNSIQPLHTQITKNELPTSEGISYLELKFNLLATYCLNLGFYMLLKVEGKSISNHPVVFELLKLRLLLEKSQSIDQKLQYQIQKLLKMTTDPTTGETVTNSLINPTLQFKPNLSALDTAEEEGDDDQSKTYKIKKVAPVAYDVDKKKKKKITTDTAMTDFIQEEFSTAPQEISLSGHRKLTSDEQHEIEFEEENFIRLSKRVKSHKKESNKINLHKSELDDPLDVHDILRNVSSYAEAIPSSSDITTDLSFQSKKRSLKQLDEERNNANPDDDFDDEIPIHTPPKKKQKFDSGSSGFGGKKKFSSGGKKSPGGGNKNKGGKGKGKAGGKGRGKN